MPIQQWSEKIWVVQLVEEPLLSEELSALYDRAKASKAMPDIVIDLSSIKLMSSSNLAQMLRMRKLSVDRESRMRLAAPRDGVWAAILTTGLDKVFEFSQDVPSALAALQMQG